MTARLDPRWIGYAVAAPLLALVFAVALAALVLAGTGDSPTLVFSRMLDYGSEPGSLVAIVNRAVPFYLSGLAVAVGFKMGLFNIGVDGQYRLAALVAAAVGGAVALPGVLHVGLVIVVAVAVGAVWAGIAGLLKVTRGVSEVISTIMLNFVATGVGAYLLTAYFSERVEGSNNTATATIAESGRVPALNGLVEAVGLDIPAGSTVNGFLLVAIAVGIGYHLLIQRTRFGFDLRATGLSPSAAAASGVDAKAMVVRTMLISGGVAGLVGLPQLLGVSYNYSIDFPAGLGFTGIGIALLGRNHPVGIAVGALLFAFLDRSAQILDLEGIPKEIVVIMQGSIVLSVVVAYEVVRRIRTAQEERAVRREAEPVPAGAS